MGLTLGDDLDCLSGSREVLPTAGSVIPQAAEREPPYLLVSAAVDECDPCPQAPEVLKSLL